MAGPSSACSRADPRSTTRPELSSRLQGFFSPPPPAQPDADNPTYAGTSPQPSSSSHPDMRLPRPQPSPSPMHHPPKQSSSLRHSHSLSMESTGISSPAAEYSAARDKKRASKPALPVLRWFSTKRSDNKSNSTPNSPVGSRPHTPSTSQPDTPTQSAPSTPSSALSALADAFLDIQLARSPRAGRPHPRLFSSFRTRDAPRTGLMNRPWDSPRSRILWFAALRSP